MSILLFEHNLKAFNAVKTAWQTTNRTCVIHATGTGKSLIVAKNIEENPTAKHLFLSPSTFIFEEIQKHLPKGIAKKIHFQSYAFFLEKEDLISDEFLNLDFIYLDEFHRVGATQWGNAVQTILEKNPAAKVLGTSATPIRYLDDNRNMAEELFNNNIASELPLGEAILQGIHRKPKYVSALYNYSEILHDTKKKIQNSTLDSNKKKSELDRLRSIEIDWNKSKGLKDILKKYLNIERKKILVFCRDTEHRDEAQKLLKPILDVLFKSKIGYYAVGSDLTEKTNIETINYFRSNVNETSVLFSINMLNEGLHVDGTDTCIFLRDTGSPIVYFQQLGRVFHTNQLMQPLVIDLINNFKLSYGIGGFTDKAFESFGEKGFSENQDLSLIVDFYDQIKDFNELIKSFKIESWEVNYEKVKTYFQENEKLPLQSSGRLGNWLDVQKTRFKNNQLSQERINLLLEITPEFFKKKIIDIPWEERYEELKQYFKENQKLPSSKLKGIGHWINTQKTKQQKNELSQEKIDLLLEITPDFFEIKVVKLPWENNYKKLEKYFQKNKKLPLQSSGIWENWIGRQRVLYKKKELSQDRIDLLLEITPDFFEEKGVRLIRNLFLTKFKNYYEEFGIIPDEGELGIWVKSQIQRYRNNQLSQNSITIICTIAPDFFDFSTSLKDIWKDKYEELKAYFQENQKLPASNSGSLGKWVNTKKVCFNKNKLSQDRIDLLLEITPDFFEIKVVKLPWESNYKKLEEYFQKNGELPPAGRNYWVDGQKTRFKKNKLSQERIDLLLKITPDFFKSPLDILFEERYEELKQYFQKNGKLPASSLKGLGRWVNHQKQLFNKNQLSKERINLLLKITPEFFEKKK